jgi:hypothetical protein
MFSPALSLGRQTADRITRDASYRDALERARRVPANSSGGLVELLDQAELVGDDLRARAVLAIGLQRGDAVAVNRYTSTRQAEEADVDRLYELLHASSTSVAVARAMRFGGV